MALLVFAVIAWRESRLQPPGTSRIVTVLVSWGLVILALVIGYAALS
jgi:hypothetical protein